MCSCAVVLFLGVKTVAGRAAAAPDGTTANRPDPKPTAPARKAKPVRRHDRGACLDVWLLDLGGARPWDAPPPPNPCVRRGKGSQAAAADQWSAGCGCRGRLS
ncbi:hypothetical protein GCM10020219_041110 [Nonomuraea dietziae]